MRRIFTNGGDDYVRLIFDGKAQRASSALLAAPYFTDADRILALVGRGASVRLLVGLNEATNPHALHKLRGIPGLAVRFLTSRFHAKIYIFDEAVLLGSANLTDGGLVSNREAVICLDREEDAEAIEEVKALFLDLWDGAAVLTDQKLEAFTASWKPLYGRADAAEVAIEKAVGKVQPRNVHVDSRKHNPEQLFLEHLRIMVYEQYRPAFSEVQSVLSDQGLRRPDLASVGPVNETNRFLNWLRLTHIHGDEPWETAPLRSRELRRALICEMGREWVETANSRVPDDYFDWLGRVDEVFGDGRNLAVADQEALTEGLMSLHAFTERSRFTRGGIKNLPKEFWADNGGDVGKVRESLLHLLHGPGDFAERLHDLLYDKEYKLTGFARYCALELFGTVRPDLCPPMNSRMAKTLRFLGFDVPV